MRQHSGFSLVELLVSLAVMMIVLSITTSVVISSMHMARNAELVVQTNDELRLAAEAIVNSARNAGMGAPNGIWVVQGGVPVRVNAMFGRDGTTGAGGVPASPSTYERDDLWLVIPNNNFSKQSCASPAVAGSSASVTAAGVGALPVSCTSGFSQTDILMVSNLRSGALLTGLQGTPVNNPIEYAEMTVPFFSNAPEKGGFQAGDLVFPVKLVHYYLETTAGGVTNLYRRKGVLTTDAWGRPFSDDPTSGAALIASDIEDFQVAFGVDATQQGDPATYAFQHGLAPEYVSGLRSLRITLVGRGSKVVRSTSSSAVSIQLPLVAENHVPAATADAYYRAKYTRRLELPNMAPESL